MSFHLFLQIWWLVLVADVFCRMFSVARCSHYISLETGPLIRGAISKIPQFVMSQQGWTKLVVWDIARAIYLIKGGSASVLLFFTFSLLRNSPQPFGSGRRGIDSQGRRLENRSRIFNLNLYLAVLHPGIKQPSIPTCQAVLFSTSRIITTTKN